MSIILVPKLPLREGYFSRNAGSELWEVWRAEQSIWVISLLGNLEKSFHWTVQEDDSPVVRNTDYKKKKKKIQEKSPKISIKRKKGLLNTNNITEASISLISILLVGWKCSVPIGAVVAPGKAHCFLLSKILCEVRGLPKIRLSCWLLLTQLTSTSSWSYLRDHPCSLPWLIHCGMKPADWFLFFTSLHRSHRSLENLPWSGQEWLAFSEDWSESGE